jgi:hypothetical protein
MFRPRGSCHMGFENDSIIWAKGGRCFVQKVDKLKGLYAEIIDLLNDIRGSERSERARLASVYYRGPRRPDVGG